MIKYKGHSISAEFRGHGVPDEHVVRRLSASGTYAEALLGGYASVEDAKAAIDAQAVCSCPYECANAGACACRCHQETAVRS